MSSTSAGEARPVRRPRSSCWRWSVAFSMCSSQSRRTSSTGILNFLSRVGAFSLSCGELSGNESPHPDPPPEYRGRERKEVDERRLHVTIQSHLESRRNDRVWRALGDRSRRRMLDLLAERPRTTGELASAFGKLSRFAVMKHLRVLHRAGLLVVSQEGR